MSTLPLVPRLTLQRTSCPEQIRFKTLMDDRIRMMGIKLLLGKCTTTSNPFMACITTVCNTMAFLKHNMVGRFQQSHMRHSRKLLTVVTSSSKCSDPNRVNSSYRRTPRTTANLVIWASIARRFKVNTTMDLSFHSNPPALIPILHNWTIQLGLRTSPWEVPAQHLKQHQACIALLIHTFLHVLLFCLT